MHESSDDLFFLVLDFFQPVYDAFHYNFSSLPNNYNFDRARRLASMIPRNPIRIFMQCAV